MAPSLRCPRCGTVVPFEPGGGGAPVCPSCGFSGAVPAAPAAPVQPAPPSPQTPGRGVRPEPAAAGLPPAPAPAAGKVASPAAVVVLGVVTLGVYTLFWWWRVSREADLLRGGRHAHPITRAGILTRVIGGAVALVALGVLAAMAYGAAQGDVEDGEFTEQEAQDVAMGLLDEALPLLLAFVVAALVAVVGWVLQLVGEYRSWSALRERELAAGRPDPVNPPLYLFLPLGLGVLGSAVPVVGGPIALAAAVLALVFLAITQAHLNDLWQGRAWGPPAGSPAPGREP